MFFSSRLSRTTPRENEPTLSSTTSLIEMSELLKQAAGVVEGLQIKIESAEQERGAACAALALLEVTAAKHEADLKEKDQLLAAAIHSLADSKKELRAYRIDSAEFEVMACERIDMLQAELEDLEKTATHRWGSLELRTSSESGADDAILDLISFPDGTPLMMRRAA